MAVTVGTCRVTGSLEFGALGANLSASLDVSGGTNLRRGAVREHYTRTLLGDFCNCSISVGGFILNMNTEIGGVGAPPGSTETLVNTFFRPVFDLGSLGISRVVPRVIGTCQSANGTFMRFRVRTFPSQGAIVSSNLMSLFTDVAIPSSAAFTFSASGPPFSPPAGSQIYYVTGEGDSTVGSLYGLTFMMEVS